MAQSLKSSIKIAVSSCLLGESVRYDGTDKQNSIITKQFTPYFNLVSLCPEVEIGMTVPREPIKIVAHYNNSNSIELVDRNDLTLNYTSKMLSLANQQAANLKCYGGYIVKERSPSCGLNETPWVSIDGEITTLGSGFFTNSIKRTIEWLPIISELELEDNEQLDNFIERVFIVNLWHAATKNNQLETFNKLIKHQIRIRGEKINNYDTSHYISNIMTILKKPITKQHQVNFLMSQLKEYKIESNQVSDAIKNYNKGSLCLWSVIQEFQFLFKENKIVSISNYFYPDELEVLTRGYYFG
ncbi:MAG: DUF523 and DUF1722 domain-containing protein [Gammaproteobacteria bacterium]